MDRRLFFQTLLAVPAAVVGIKLVPTHRERILARLKLLVKEAMNEMRTQLDRSIYGGAVGGGKTEPMYYSLLKSIPYHQREALRTGRWK